MDKKMIQFFQLKNIKDIQENINIFATDDLGLRVINNLKKNNSQRNLFLIKNNKLNLLNLEKYFLNSLLNF
jgi:hypothetical protein